MPVLSCITIKTALPQNIRFTKISKKDGLSSNETNCVYKDHRGFIWIGTDDGLNCYDGKTFTYYKYQHDNPYSISNNRIIDITECADSNLWISTNNGLNRYLYHYDRFERYYSDTLNKTTLSDNQLRFFYLDNTNTLWLTSRLGLNRFVKHKNKTYTFKRYYPERIINDGPKRVEYSLYNIIQSKDGYLWIGSWAGGLIRFDIQNEEFYHYRHDDNNPMSVSSNNALHLDFDENQRIWTGTSNNGINIFDPATETFQNITNNSKLKKLFENDNNIRSVFRDKKNNIWIGTLKSLYVLNSKTLDLLYYSNSLVNCEKNKERLPKEEIKDIYQDNTNIIWLASNKEGIYKYDPNQYKFSDFYISVSSTDRRDHITGFIKDKDDNLWISTFGDGLLLCTKSGKIRKRFTKPLISSDSLNTIFVDTNGMIWIGGINGIDIINQETGKIEKSITLSKESEQNLKHRIINKIIQDKDKNMWIETQEGINIIRYENYKIIKNQYIDNIGIKKIHNVIKDKNNNIVIVGIAGAAIYNVATHKIHYMLPDIFKNYEFYCCKQDKNGIYWFGTDNGLLSLNTNTKQLREWTTEDGLFSSWITDIEIIDGEIWMKTKGSISRLHTSTGIIHNYTLHEGLSQRGRNIWHDNSGTLYVADEAGFFRFKPHEIKYNTLVPPVYFTGFYLNGIKAKIGENAILKKHIAYTDEIVLDYSYKTIRFTFSALNYTLPEKNHYKYFLQGYDTSWIQLDNKNEVTFMNLAPGSYVLKVKASNNDGIWNPEEASVKFKIMPPWWKTWQATSIFLIVFTMLILFYRYLSIKNEKKISEMNKLKELNAMKLQLFTNISHEFRTPLSLILGPLNKVLKKKNLGSFEHFHISMAEKNAQRMHRLVNQIMDLRKLDTDNIQLHYEQTNILVFIKKIIETFTYEAIKKKIKTTLQSSFSELIIPMDTNVTEKIISNLLSNAFKYTPQNGNIVVDIDIISPHNKKQLVISIADTGKGIPRKEMKHIFDRFYRSPDLSYQNIEGTGIGLHLVKEMTILLGGHVNVKENKPHGTIFTVSLPVNKGVRFLPAHNKQKLDIIPTHNNYYSDNNKKNKNKDAGIILIVEDNHELCWYISDLFVKEGYNVLRAFNGKEGLEMVHQHFPIVVISDIMMPEINGIELCGKIKTEKNTSHIPVVLLTAKSLTEHQIEGYKTGADAYVTKPFNDRVLLAQINNLLSNREKLKTYFSSISYKNINTAPNVSKTDKNFLTDVEKTMAENYADEHFTVEKFAECMHISRVHLNRKFRSFIGISPVDYLRTYRLNKAAELLKSNANLSVAEVAYQTGFKHPSNFTRSFQKHFNILPTDLMNH